MTTELEKAEARGDMAAALSLPKIPSDKKTGHTRANPSGLGVINSNSVH